MTDKIARFIATAQPSPDKAAHYNIRQVRELLGPRYNCMFNSLVSEAEMTITARYITKVPPGFKSGDKLQRHIVSQLYTIIGNFTLELLPEDEKHEINGPGAVFIPAHKMLGIHPLGGSGHLIAVTNSEKPEFLGSH